MTNVIMFPNRITEQTHAAPKPKATAGSPLVWGMLGMTFASLGTREDKDRLERKAKSEQLQALLVHAFTELANHAGQQAAIDFTMSKIKAFRRGCGNE